VFSEEQGMSEFVRARPFTARQDGSLPLHVVAASGGESVVHYLVEKAPETVLAKDNVCAVPCSSHLIVCVCVWVTLSEATLPTSMLITDTSRGSATVWHPASAA
jgi:hypothetical protein